MCPSCKNETSDGLSNCLICGNPIQTIDLPIDNLQATRENTLTNNENLSLFGYYIKCWKNFADFNNRARRKEFWGYQLFDILLFILVVFVCDFTIGLSSGDFDGLTYLYGFITFLPRLAVFCRRMHDIGRSGAWWLLLFIPIIGLVVLLVMCCIDSQSDKNEYGDYPKKSI